MAITAANSERAAAPPAAGPDPTSARRERAMAVYACTLLLFLALGLLWRYPLFRVNVIRPGQGANPTIASVVSAGATRFEPAEFAGKFWQERLLPGCAQAADAAVVVELARRDPAAAVQRFARQVGLGGTAYYFVQGAGRVVRVEKDRVILAMEGASAGEIALLSGPLFGNTVRDGTGLLNVNGFPGLEEFNALAAELNRLVEARVHPVLRRTALVGRMLEFAGCAEATDSGSGRAGPVLSIVPLQIAEKK